MKVAILADEGCRAGLLAQGTGDALEIVWLEHLKNFDDHSDADAFIDLLFIPEKNRIEILNKPGPRLKFVNAVIPVLSQLPENFVRINGWPAFLDRPVLEAACSSVSAQSIATAIFSAFNKTICWTPDVPGFISPRVIAMIINEAYFTLQEEISSKQEIDTAMKLGTGYPYGPFEWCGKIGLKNVYKLLTTLVLSDQRYEPATLLKNEALSG